MLPFLLRALRAAAGKGARGHLEQSPLVDDLGDSLAARLDRVGDEVLHGLQRWVLDLPGRTPT
eukprot:2166659-Pyramimonas_sp.AAC.1